VIRPVQPEDVPFLRQMIYEAAYPSGRPPTLQEEALAESHAARFVEGWGRPGDFGVVAVEGGRPVGAAWCRLFDEARPGWGVLDDRTPELAIAVVADHRGRGVGGRMLAELLRLARHEGFDAVSLGVSKENRHAIGMYRRHGFVAVAEDDRGFLMRAGLPPALG
jgi:ribosomal protein S18 acetylase RimI-like enzyme